MILNVNFEKKLTDPLKVVDLIKKIFEIVDETDKLKERFYTIGVNSELEVLYVELVAIGTLNKCYITAKEIFRTAILKGATSIFIVHNHISSIKPSEQDLLFTKAIAFLGYLHDIDLLDSIIVANDGKEFYSISKEHEELFNIKNLQKILEEV